MANEGEAMKRNRHEQYGKAAAVVAAARESIRRGPVMAIDVEAIREGVRLGMSEMSAKGVEAHKEYIERFIRAFVVASERERANESLMHLAICMVGWGYLEGQRAGKAESDRFHAEQERRRVEILSGIDRKPNP